MHVRYGDGLVTFEVAEDSAVGYAARLNGLKAAAAGKLARYPQYVGYHDGPEWVLVKVKRKVRTKMGEAFEKDEVALARWRSAKDDVDDLEGWTVWSVSNGVHTHLPPAWAEQMKPVLG